MFVSLSSFIRFLTLVPLSLLSYLPHPLSSKMTLVVASSLSFLPVCLERLFNSD